jgi:hypothetical protein
LVPNLFIPSEWLAAVHTLPRLSATIAMALSISMLAVGLRAYRWYLVAAAAASAWVVGLLLAHLMNVTGWYVALPSVVLVAPLVWPSRVAKMVMPLCVGFAVGCALGAFFAFGAEIASFWLGFAIGACGGTAAALLAPRFMNALFFACAGAMGFVASLGAVVRASDGLFAAGAYREDPTIFLIVALLLVIGSTIAQAALDPEAHL